jgi:hypothetical protein
VADGAVVLLLVLDGAATELNSHATAVTRPASLVIVALLAWASVS